MMRHIRPLTDCSFQTRERWWFARKDSLDSGVRLRRVVARLRVGACTVACSISVGYNTRMTLFDNTPMTWFLSYRYSGYVCVTRSYLILSSSDLCTPCHTSIT